MITRLLQWSWQTLSSVTGRMFILLSLGVTAAATLSLGVAEHGKRNDFEKARLGGLVARAEQLQARWLSSEDPRLRDAALNQQLGVRLLARAPAFEREPRLEDLLAQTLGPPAAPHAGLTTLASCVPEGAELNPDALAPPARDHFDLRIECWVISFSPSPGERLVVSMFAPPFVSSSSSMLNPTYIAGLLLASALLALLAARFVTSPLQQLSQAAEAFSVTRDAPVVKVRGPVEVRRTLNAFNVMQGRVRDGLSARTQLLAAISHDLQTPLTRMRLRVEQVRSREVRDRLVADIKVMQGIVREGLDLARSQETHEPWSVVDLDSLVESLAEDAAELGGDVRFVSGCRALVRVRPSALARAINNLVENALKYGGSAQVSCHLRDQEVEIRVRDHGRGLDDPNDPRLFEPFYREQLDGDKPKGSGIGLTIARAQARLTGASIQLANHEGGGVLARIVLSATALVRS